MIAPNLASKECLARSARASTHGRLHRTVSAIALSSVGIGLAMLATPAQAQCVAGPPNFFTCSGQTNTSQILVGANPTAVTTPGFAVDTSGNGNGLALTITGTGAVVYTDLNASTLAGAGVSFFTTGSEGLNSGEIIVFSIGDILVDGATGLRLANAGGGDTNVVWGGSIVNTGGRGILSTSEAGGGDLTLIVSDVIARDDGIEVQYSANGSVLVNSGGGVTGQTGAGIRVNAGAAADDVVVQAIDVTGGTWGIVVDNQGTEFARVISTETVTGLSEAGIAVVGGSSSTGIDIDVNEVSGQTAGIQAFNSGSGATTIRATGTVIGQTSEGIAVETGIATDNIAIDVVNVSGNRGIFTNHQGTGDTFINATGLVSGVDTGILSENGLTTTDLIIRATDVQGGLNGIIAQNLGSGLTRVVTTGTVTGLGEQGISAFGGASSNGIEVDAVNATGGTNGIATSNTGTGPTQIIVRGLVEGGSNAVAALSTGTQDVAIINDGELRNLVGGSFGSAIIASGGFVELTNSGQMVGSINLTASSSSTLNAGVWNSIGGTSVFAGGADVVVNGGLITGGSGASAVDTTSWSGLELFENSAQINLQDGGTGDAVRTSANTSFFEGSSLAVDIGGQSGADLYATDGTLDIQFGTELSVNIVQPLTLNSQYVVAEADAGLTGTFFDFEDQFLTAFAGLRDGYTATTAFVEFTQLRALVDAGLTPNQKATAAGADTLPDGNAVKDALLLLPTDADAQYAFDQLSGEVHASAKGLFIEQSGLIRSAMIDRLRASFGAVAASTAPVMAYAAPTGPGASEAGMALKAVAAHATTETFALWASGFGAWGDMDGDGNAASLSSSTGGFLIGADATLGAGWRLGLTGGYSSTDFDVDARASSGSSENWHLGLYAGNQWGALGLRTGLAYTFHDVETSRSVAFTGFGDYLSADYDASTFQAFGELGYRMDTAFAAIEPFANLAYVSFDTDGFTEQGGPAALTGSSSTTDTTFTTLGLRASTTVLLGSAETTLRGALSWRHAFGDITPLATQSFFGSQSFTVAGTPIAEDAALVEAGFDVLIGTSTRLGAAYTGQFGDGVTQNGFNATLNVSF